MISLVIHFDSLAEIWRLKPENRKWCFGSFQNIICFAMAKIQAFNSFLQQIYLIFLINQITLIFSSAVDLFGKTLGTTWKNPVW